MPSPSSSTARSSPPSAAPPPAPTSSGWRRRPASWTNSSNGCSSRRDRPLASANIYLSGLDLPAEIAEFRAGIAGYAWADAIVDNDLFALLRAGTSEWG